MEPKIKPNSKCKKCGREFNVQGFDDDQVICPNPKCGSTEILNLHLENLPDIAPDIAPQQLTLEIEEM